MGFKHIFALALVLALIVTAATAASTIDKIDKKADKLTFEYKPDKDIKASDLKIVNKKEVFGKGEFNVFTLDSWTQIIPTFTENCVTSTWAGNGTAYPSCTQTQTGVTGITKTGWKDVKDSVKTLEKGKVQRVKIEADLTIADCGTGWCYAVYEELTDGVNTYSGLTWWNASYIKRDCFNYISGNSTDDADFQIYHNLTYDGDMHSDFSDIRVAEDSTNVLQDFCPLNQSNTNYADLWIKAKWVNTTNLTMCVYYANTTAGGGLSASDCKATFLYYSNGTENETTDYTGWTAHGTSYAVDWNSTIKATELNISVNSAWVGSYLSGGDPWPNVEMNTTYSIDGRTPAQTQSWFGEIVRADTAGSNTVRCALRGSACADLGKIFQLVNNAEQRLNNTPGCPDALAPKVVTMSCRVESVNATNKISNTTSTYTAHATNVSVPANATQGYYGFKGVAGTSPMVIDLFNITVRKLATLGEPIVYSMKGEETYNQISFATSPAIVPATAYVTNQLNCTFKATNTVNLTLKANVTWFLNDTANSTYDATGISCGNNTICATSQNVTNLQFMDVWKCKATVYDEVIASTTENSTTRTISNTVPTIGNPTLNTTTPPINVAILCNNGSYFDPDNTTITWYYRWWNGSDLLPNGTAAIYLSNLSFHKGDTPKCSTLASDQTANATAWTNSTVATIQNTVPTVPTVDAILPNPAYRGSNLTSSCYDSSDPDGDTLAYSLKWNTTPGALLQDWTDNATTGFFFTCNSTTNCNKTYGVAVYGRAYDGTAYSVTATQSQTISNTAPVLNPVPALNWTTPNLDAVIKCNNGTFTDADPEDGEGASGWQWWNGTILTGVTTQTLFLNSSLYQYGNLINCSQRVSDGTTYSSYYNSSNTANITASTSTTTTTVITTTTEGFPEPGNWTTFSETATYFNDVTGGMGWTFSVIGLWFVVFLATKVYPTGLAMIAASLAAGLYAIPLAVAGLVSGQVVAILVMLAALAGAFLA